MRNKRFIPCHHTPIRPRIQTETKKIQGDRIETRNNFHLTFGDQSSRVGEAADVHSRRLEPRGRSIENNLHWVLDVTFKEDHCRARKLNAAHNFALIRQVLLGLLKAETSVKRSIAKKRSRCAWGPDYMLTVLAAAD